MPSEFAMGLAKKLSGMASVDYHTWWANIIDEELKLLIAERDQFRDLCRSALAIAKREGNQTNWSAFAGQLEDAFAQLRVDGGKKNDG